MDKNDFLGFLRRVLVCLPFRILIHHFSDKSKVVKRVAPHSFGKERFVFGYYHGGRAFFVLRVVSNRLKWEQIRRWERDCHLWSILSFFFYQPGFKKMIKGNSSIWDPKLTLSKINLIDSVSTIKANTVNTIS